MSLHEDFHEPLFRSQTVPQVIFRIICRSWVQTPVPITTTKKNYCQGSLNVLHYMQPSIAYSHIQVCTSVIYYYVTKCPKLRGLKENLLSFLILSWEWSHCSIAHQLKDKVIWTLGSAGMTKVVHSHGCLLLALSRSFSWDFQSKHLVWNLYIEGALHSGQAAKRSAKKGVF
jgi:hypothetical protein